MSGCLSEHVIPNTFEFVSPQKKLSSRGPNVISIAYLESSCTSGCFKSVTMEIRQPKKELDVFFLSQTECHSEYVIPNICHSENTSLRTYVIPNTVEFVSTS